MCRLIWIDNNIKNDENKNIYEFFKLQFSDTDLVVCETIEEGLDSIRNTVKAVVMLSGGIAWAVLPKIKSFKNIRGVTVFCGG